MRIRWTRHNLKPSARNAVIIFAMFRTSLPPLDKLAETCIDEFLQARLLYL